MNDRTRDIHLQGEGRGAEPYDGLVSIDGVLSFDLHDGTSMERAKEIAQIINNNIRSLAITT